MNPWTPARDKPVSHGRTENRRRIPEEVDDGDSDMPSSRISTSFSLAMGDADAAFGGAAAATGCGATAADGGDTAATGTASTSASAGAAAALAAASSRHRLLRSTSERSPRLEGVGRR